MTGRDRAGLALFGLLVLGACAAPLITPPAPATPAQAVYEAAGAYAGALSIAVAYRNLPACGSTGATAVCSDPTVVAKLRAADTSAEAMLRAAEVVVSATPALPVNVQQQAVLASQLAVQALTAITTTLKVH